MKNISPFNFVEYSKEDASITLEADMKYQLFEKHGVEPTGYSWERVFQTYLEKNHPDIAKNIAYDPEAGLFACYGTKETVKEALPYLLELYHNNILLEKIIATL